MGNTPEDAEVELAVEVHELWHPMDYSSEFLNQQARAKILEHEIHEVKRKTRKGTRGVFLKGKIYYRYIGMCELELEKNDRNTISTKTHEVHERDQGVRNLYGKFIPFVSRL